MDYEKKYKVALGWMRDVYPTLEGAAREDAEHYFPELKESEDERIRKELIKQVVYIVPNDDETDNEGNVLPIYQQRIDKYIAWLEKQGAKVSAIEGFESEFERQVSCLIASTINKEHEYNQGYVKWTANALLNFAKHELEKQCEQNPAVIIPKFRIGDYVKNVNDKREPIYEIVYMDKECYVCEYRGEENMGDKAVMHFAFDFPYLRHIQKPAWSEEDEEIYRKCICAMRASACGFPEEEKFVEQVDNWPKSLKDRYSWKPSDEQLKALRLLNLISGISYAGQKQELIDLYNDLKKLKE